MADQEEDFSKLPLPDRFSHKNWKVRKEGYEAAAAEFEKTPDENAPVFRPFLNDSGLMKGAVADSNVAAQQEGIAALCAFLKFGGRDHASRTRSSTVAPLVEKGLPSTRAAAKANALEALMLYVEIEKADLVIEEMMPFLTHKQPKVIAATLAAMTQLYHAYGVKIIDPKPVLKAMPKLFGHADKNVRAEASNLIIELYRWLKEAIKSLFWNDLKPVQQADLEKAFEPVKAEPAPKQERLLRSQQAAPPQAAATGGGGDDEDYGEEVEEEEVVSLAEPVNVYSKIPADFNERLSSSKWKDRKEALDDLYVVANTERIQEGPFDDVIALLAKSMKDANIAVVTVAANNVEVLAKGLRKGFAKYRSRIMAPILERCKEKKQSVADALGAALDAVFSATSLSDCLEEILEFLKHKNPQVKLETLKFLIRCLRNTREAPSAPETKSIADAATKLLTESTEVTRSGGAEILGTLMKIMGERAMNPYMDSLDDIRKTKIKEYFEAAEVKAKNKPKPPPAAKQAPPSARKPASAPKKLAPGLGMKKAAPVSAPLEDIGAPKALTRPGPPRLVPPTKSGLAAPSGLKMQPKKIGGPTPTASPARRVAAPQPMEEEPIPQPRLGLGAPRGLVGRTLSKPTTQLAEPISAPLASGMSVADRAELEALRSEREGFMKDIADLRGEKKKMEAQLHDLRVQEAELIEERTRDRLTIRAKEQQVVRVRGEADSALAELEQQKQQNERLKRELHRTIRPTSPPSDYVDTSVSNGAAPFSIASIDRYESNRMSRAVGYQRARSYMTSPSEEKENGGLESRAGKSPVRISRDQRSEASSQGPHSPGSSGLRNGEPVTAEPIENWKRAAEVTSALRAKIDQLKTRQGISRGH